MNLASFECVRPSTSEHEIHDHDQAEKGGSQKHQKGGRGRLEKSRQVATGVRSLNERAALPLALALL
jgi:hypothetical protein